MGSFSSTLFLYKVQENTVMLCSRDLQMALKGKERIQFLRADPEHLYSWDPAQDGRAPSSSDLGEGGSVLFPLECL